MKEKILVLVLLSVVLSMYLVSGALTLNTPAASATVSGTTAKLNVSFSANDGTFNTTNYTCIFYAKSAALTANTSWVTLATIPNNTVGNGGGNFVNATFNSWTLEDGNDYIFNATCMNLTASSQVTTTGVIIQNTVPQAPTLSPVSNTQIVASTTQTFTGTVVNGNTTACTYTIARGGTTSGDDYITGTATYSASTCSFSKAFTSTNNNGNWYWKITASDGTDTTDSATNTLQVQIAPTGGSQPKTQAQTSSSTSSTNVLTKPLFQLGNFNVTLLVLIIGGGIIWAYQKYK